MASSMMHLAVTQKVLDRLCASDPLRLCGDSIRLGSVLLDASGKDSHLRVQTPDGQRTIDLDQFRREYAGRLLSDGFALGWYLHLVQDLFYRYFMYREHSWNPRLPGYMPQLYNDYRLLNPILAEACGLKPPTIPEALKGHPLLPPGAERFLQDMEQQFAPWSEGEYFFLTREMAEEYVSRAAELCLSELDALRSGAPGINQMDYAYPAGMLIREMREEEYPLLRDFLYDAIFQRDENNLLPRDVVDNPELRIYIEDFGKKPQDRCLCAELKGQLAGAVWVRDIPAYGHIADGVPEFAISVKKEHRGCGLGTKLMQEMIRVLRTNGCPRASLAVQKDNYALRMYKAVGFEIIGENEEEYIMEIRL